MGYRKAVTAIIAIAIALTFLAVSYRAQSVSGSWWNNNATVAPGTYDPLTVSVSGFSCGNGQWWAGQLPSCSWQLIWSNATDSCPDISAPSCNQTSPYPVNCIMASGTLTSSSGTFSGYSPALAGGPGPYTGCLKVSSSGYLFGWWSTGGGADVANYPVGVAPTSPDLLPIQLSTSSGAASDVVKQGTLIYITLNSTAPSGSANQLWIELANSVGSPNGAATGVYGHCVGIGPPSWYPPTTPPSRLPYCSGGTTSWANPLTSLTIAGDCILANTSATTGVNTLTVGWSTYTLPSSAQPPVTYDICGYEGAQPLQQDATNFPSQATATELFITPCIGGAYNCETHVNSNAVTLNSISDVICGTYNQVNTIFLLLALVVLIIGAVLFMASHSMPGAMRGTVQGYAVGMMIAGVVSALISVGAAWLLSVATGTSVGSILGQACPAVPVNINPPPYITNLASQAASFPTIATSVASAPATSGVTTSTTTSVTTTTTVILPVHYDIVFGTSPSSLTGVSGTTVIVTVDGVNYKESQLPETIVVNGGSTVTYSWDSPFVLTAGADEWGFSSVAGTCGGTSQSGSFIVSGACNEQGNYIEYYYLTMNPGPGGTVTPSSGWEPASTGVSISASAGASYIFTSWTGTGSGSYSGTTNPCTSCVTMSGPVTENAEFTPTYSITFALSPSPLTGTKTSADTVFVQHIQYTEAQMPVTITVANGVYVGYSYSSPVTVGSGDQWIFNSLSGCGQSAQSGSFKASSTCTITATYKEWYYLQMNAGFGGSVTPTSEWVLADSVHTITATADPNNAFVAWDGTGTGSYSGTVNPNTLTVNSNGISETAQFGVTIKVTFATSPSSLSGISGGNTVLVVTGLGPYTESQLPVQVTVPANVPLTFAWTNPETVTSGEDQWLWYSTSGCGAPDAASGTVNPGYSACTITATYERWYALTMIAGAGGTVSPSSEWLQAGTLIPKITATPSTYNAFARWSGIGTNSYSGTTNPYTSSLDMSSPVTESAAFESVPPCSDLTLQISYCNGDFTASPPCPGGGQQASQLCYTGFQTKYVIYDNSGDSGFIKDIVEAQSTSPVYDTSVFTSSICGTPAVNDITTSTDEVLNVIGISGAGGGYCGAFPANVVLLTTTTTSVSTTTSILVCSACGTKTATCPSGETCTVPYGAYCCSSSCHVKGPFYRCS